jgi:hypothetical protein
LQILSLFIFSANGVFRFLPPPPKKKNTQFLEAHKNGDVLSCSLNTGRKISASLSNFTARGVGKMERLRGESLLDDYSDWVLKWLF